MFDLVVKNGKVIDGTGNGWFNADVGVVGEKIGYLGGIEASEGDKVIDVDGLFVAPGFIDFHAHSDYLLLADPHAENKLVQGVTTDVSGNCGFSPGPFGLKWLVDWWVADKPKDENGETIWTVDWDEANKICKKELGYTLDWKTIDEYLQKQEKIGAALNYCQLVGHHALRAAATGDVIRKPTKDELKEMERLLDQAMKEGAFGFSCGFDIAQKVDAEEFVKLCEVVARYGGIFANHFRPLYFEEPNFPNMEFREAYPSLSVYEAIQIAEKAGVRMTISHLTVDGKANWGKSEIELKMIDEARSRGVEIVLDQIPFLAGGNYWRTELIEILPDWIRKKDVEDILEELREPETRQKVSNELREGVPGNRMARGLRRPFWEDAMTIAYCGTTRELEWKTMREIAREKRMDEREAIFELILENEGLVNVVWFTRSDEETIRIMQHPLTMFGSDGGILRAIEREMYGKGEAWNRIPNPRVYGTFPRVLGRYVREKKVLRLEEAIRKMTSAPALTLGIGDRGLLRKGFYADIVVLDPETVMDTPSYVDWPPTYTKGIEHVIVNGGVALENGKPTEELHGKILRHKLERL